MTPLKLKSLRHFTFWIVFAITACGPVRFSTKDTSADSTTTGTTPTGPGPTSTLTRDVHFSSKVSTPSNKLDILLIVDNSNSMLADNQKLASKLTNFVSKLQSSSLDWQMCATVTSTLMVNGTARWGASVIWSDYTPASGVSSWVLKAGTPNLSAVFTDTINSIGAGWASTDDERGIKAAWWHLWNGDIRYSGNSGCYRDGAAVSMILISDEDERSVGGVQADEYYQGEYQPLENDDLPATLVGQVQDVFGATKKFTFNSIIVDESQPACMTAQDAAGSKSHYGRKYAELSRLTSGGIGSICDGDFSTNLNYFADRIQTSIASFPLECTPYNNLLSYTVNGSASGYSMTLQSMSALFSPALTSGATLTMDYKCIVN